MLVSRFGFLGEKSLFNVCIFHCIFSILLLKNCLQSILYKVKIYNNGLHCIECPHQKASVEASTTPLNFYKNKGAPIEFWKTMLSFAFGFVLLDLKGCFDGSLSLVFGFLCFLSSIILGLSLWDDDLVM
jgi:hypothetical protein